MNKLSLVPLSNTKIDDGFWNRYLKLVPEVIIPYQWNILNDNVADIETSHCIANFRIAAGLEQGEHYGMVFQDTDLAKWLEAVAFSLATSPDKELEKTADEAIDLIEKVQTQDGYINTYYIINGKGKRFTNLREGHELYTAGHFMEAAVAYYQATKKDKFLKIMCRFADLICDVFSEEKNSRGCPGHQEVEIGLFKLYEVTGEDRYLRQAKSFLERRGKEPNYFDEERKKPEFKMIFSDFEPYDPKYAQVHLPIRKQKTAEGHAVRAVYMYSAMADVAGAYEDTELLGVCEQIWNDMVYRRMYITGSIGSSGFLERFTTDYDLPNGSNYSETCASIGLALFGRRMAALTRNGKYIDVVERALYNTVLSGIAMDGKSFFYVNPLEVWPASCMPRTSKEHVKPIRQKWFGVACCPPNIARTLASLGEYIYFLGEDSVWINLFISSKTQVTFQQKRVDIEIKTNFPNTGNIKVLVDAEDSTKGEIALRIPDYARKVTVTVNGVQMQKKIIEKGYLLFSREWNTDIIELSFEMKPRFVHANPLVREDIGKVAIVRGPLIYCLEEVDNGTNLSAVYLSTDTELVEEYCEQLLGGTMLIKALGKKMVSDNWKANELYMEIAPKFENQALTFVPYPYWGNRENGEMLVWVKEF